TRVLDSGCCSVNITRLLLDRDFVLAADEWDDFVAHMSASFADADNLAIERVDLADPEMPAQLERHAIDSVFCANVLEHIEDDRAALGNMAALLPRGAPIFLLVPAFPVLYGEHDRADHHFRRYTKRSLRRAV